MWFGFLVFPFSAKVLLCLLSFLPKITDMFFHHPKKQCKQRTAWISFFADRKVYFCYNYCSEHWMNFLPNSKYQFAIIVVWISYRLIHIHSRLSKGVHSTLSSRGVFGHLTCLLRKQRTLNIIEFVLCQGTRQNS